MPNQYTAFRFVDDTHKECSKCSKIKLHSEFHKDKNNRHRNLAFYCKPCANEAARKHHANRMQNDPMYKEIKRASSVKRAHGITLQQYEAKLVAQHHKCAICEVKLLSRGTGTHLDHCHKSGKLRDMLCTNCNRGLGHFQDNTQYLTNAVKYLNSHNSSCNDEIGGSPL